MSNNKQKRTDGVIHSSNITFPSSSQCFNCKTAEVTPTKTKDAVRNSNPNQIS